MTPSSAQATRLPALPRTILLAAAATGAAELILHRVVAPVLAHIPSDGAGRAITDAARLGGDRAFHATALLVVVGLLAYLATASWRRDITPSLVALAAASTLVLLLSNAPPALAHVALIAAVVGLAAAALARGPRLLALPVAVAAAAMVAARVPLLLDSLALPSGDATTATVAEAAFVLVPPLLAASLLARTSPPRVAWVAAGGTSLVAAAALASSPSYTAILSAWSTGVTLSLPVPLYIVAAGCAAFVLVSWLAEPSSRHLAAGLVLLAVAGVHPAVVHHNVTAVLALLLLATPAADGGALRVGQPQASRTAAAHMRPAAIGSE